MIESKVMTIVMEDMADWSKRMKESSYDMGGYIALSMVLRKLHMMFSEESGDSCRQIQTMAEESK